MKIIITKRFEVFTDDETLRKMIQIGGFEHVRVYNLDDTKVKQLLEQGEDKFLEFLDGKLKEGEGK